jgi:PAS domain S-box-containing protein
MTEASRPVIPVESNWSESVAESLPGLVWSTDSALRIATCHGAELSSMGRRGEDLVGTSLFELFETEDVDYPVIRAHRLALAGQPCPVAFSLAGTVFRGMTSPLRQGDKIVGCVTLAFLLPSFGSRCEAIVSTTSDLILFLQPDGTIEEANRTATGSPREGVVGKSIFEFTPPDEHERLRETMRRVMQTGQPAELEVGFPRRFGTPAWQIMRIGPIHTLGEVTGLVLLATDITDRKQSLERLEAEERLLRDLLELQDRERRLVAYEIHDGFIQDVVGARMIIQGIRQMLMDIDVGLYKRLDTAVSLMARAISEGRRLISELRPMIIDEMGLIDAIDYLVGEEESSGDIEFTFTHRMEADRLPPLLQATIFRILREAVTNARRHGRATRVDIRLTQVGGQYLIVEVQDNGRGFDPSRVPKDRLGLSGIRERARLFGGGASIESSPGAGTRITVKVALNAPANMAQSDQITWTWTV